MQHEDDVTDEHRHRKQQPEPAENMEEENAYKNNGQQQQLGDVQPADQSPPQQIASPTDQAQGQ